jgi:hypothetical protein
MSLLGANNESMIGPDKGQEYKLVAYVNAFSKATDWSRLYLAITRDLIRVMTRVKAIYRSWGIPCAGQLVYAHRTTPRDGSRSWRSKARTVERNSNTSNSPLGEFQP